MKGERFLGCTKERVLHDLDKEDDSEHGCRIDAILEEGNERPFITPQSAFVAGFDPCEKCDPDLPH